MKHSKSTIFVVKKYNYIEKHEKMNQINVQADQKFQ